MKLLTICHPVTSMHFLLNEILHEYDLNSKIMNMKCISWRTAIGSGGGLDDNGDSDDNALIHTQAHQQQHNSYHLGYIVGVVCLCV